MRGGILVNEFVYIVSNVADGTRPATNLGTSVTPAENAYGSYAQLLAGASVTATCYEIEIEANTVGISGSARDCLVTIGIDPAGGTSYTDLITDLIFSCGSRATQLGVVYRFPLLIPAGASIAAKASVNTSTLTAIRVIATLRGNPTRPSVLKYGTFVTTFGSTPASSSGTAITAGTTSEGAWTQVGSTLSVPHWYWEFGIGINDSTMSNNHHHVDVGLGDGSNKRVVIRDHPVCITNGEQISKLIAGRSALGAIGDGVYVRTQVGPNADDSNVSVAVYGVGG